jgi:hypothetical protein
MGTCRREHEDRKKGAGQFRSLLEIAKRQDKEPHRFLFDLFTRRSTDAQAAVYRSPPDHFQPVREAAI